jgi:predicted AlkP superfamily phosphohydrolase/phosphomutase
MSETSERRVFVIGLDGATLDLILPWVREGRLPNLALLMADGAYGKLRSTIHPMTAQAWTSFMTGKNLGKHGLVDFFMRRPGTYELQIVNAMSRDGETVWGILSQAGKRVGVLNVPMTYPPEPVNGFLVAGMDTPTRDSQFTDPPQLKEELLKAVPNYRIEPGGYRPVPGDERRCKEFIEETWGAAEARFEATKYLMERSPWDFFMVVFRATDRVQHWFWKHMDPQHPLRIAGDEEYADVILKTYERMDAMLGYFVEGLGDKVTIIVVSDHGAIPIGHKVIYLNTWLAQESFLKFKPDSGSGALGRNTSVSGLLWRLWRRMKRSLPADERRALKSAFPRLERKVTSHLTFADIDWTQTRAYAMEQREAIWINLEGREPQGRVKPGEEYERLRDEIIERLMGFTDPETNQPIVERVYKREELYHGPHLDKVPDLLLCLAEAGYRYRLARHNPARQRKQAIEILGGHELMTDYRASAGHALDGVCILRGEGIRAGYEIEGAHIMDMAPTILHLMGEAVPNDMDGRVLEEIFDPQFLASHPVAFRDVQPRESVDIAQRTYASEEEQEVLERLQGLGYLD